jgi:hypothetical protein
MGTIGMMDDGDPRPFQSDCQHSSARRPERIAPETLVFRRYKGSPLKMPSSPVRCWAGWTRKGTKTLRDIAAMQTFLSRLQQPAISVALTAE